MCIRDRLDIHHENVNGRFLRKTRRQRFGVDNMLDGELAATRGAFDHAPDDLDVYKRQAVRRMQLDAIESGSLSTGRRVGECLGELMQIGNRGLHRHDAGLRVGDGRRPEDCLLYTSFGWA